MTARATVSRAAAMIAATRSGWAETVQLRSQARMLRRACRASRARLLLEPGATFTMTGMLGDHLVTASFAHGRLECDPRLLTIAMLLVDLAERFENGGAGVAASVGGDPLPTLLTVMRACDHIVQVDADLA